MNNSTNSGASFHDSATDLADTLRSIAHEATEAVMHDCQLAGYALGVLVTKVNQLADVLDGALDSDPLAEPTIDTERPTYHEPMPMVSSQWEQTPDGDGNIWWTEHRLPKQGERYVFLGDVLTLKNNMSLRRNVIVGGPL